MPSRKEHLKASKVWLGYATPIVHDLLDRYLPTATEHRRTHTPSSIKAIGVLLGKDAEREAWLHFLMDYHLC